MRLVSPAFRQTDASTEKRTELVQIRVTPSEMEHLRALAERERRTVANLVRAALAEFSMGRGPAKSRAKFEGD